MFTMLTRHCQHSGQALGAPTFHTSGTGFVINDRRGVDDCRLPLLLPQGALLALADFVLMLR